MINYQTAKKNALFIDEKVNSCIEFDDAYYFYEDKGYGDTFEGFIIAKEDGRAADYSDGQQTTIAKALQWCLTLKPVKD